MVDAAFDTTDPRVRAELVKQIARERDRVDYWRNFPDFAEAMAEAQAAVDRYTALLAEGEADV